MARGVKKLSALAVSKANKPGLYGDGAGLWLQVSKAGNKSWLLRYMLDGKAREMGLGAVHTVSLAEARERAAESRKLLLEGIDPLEVKRQRKQQSRLDAAKSMTFAECAEAYIAAHRAGWSNAKHAAQWVNTLKQYANPVFGELSIAAIDTGLVLKALEPIWQKKTETATRIRQRIESVLDWAKVRGYREGENPARWRGHLDKLLPAPSRVAKVSHYAALPYKEIPAFMEALRKSDSIGARAFEFAILTAARTSEAIGARWEEIDMKEGLWVVPGERMKAGREHRVPLSKRAITILRKMQEIKQGDYVFPGKIPNKPLSNMAFLMTLRRMKRNDLTAHGFRSTFRDWVSETTGYPQEVGEMVLAHTINNKVEAAYRRGDLFIKRQRLMDDWASYCESPVAEEGENVVTLRGKTTG